MRRSIYSARPALKTLRPFNVPLQAPKMTIGPTAYFHELVDKIEALERLFVVPEGLK